MNTTKLTAIASLAGAASLSAFTGGYDYKDLLKNGGTFYSDSSNSLIQKARVYGRAQYQAATVFQGSESENYVALRRLRVGSEVQFLNYFKFKGNIGFNTGGNDDIQVDGIKGWDTVGLTFDLGKAFDISAVDSLKLTVGKRKFKIGEDVHTSSKKIKTIERTRITDSLLRGDNSTGVELEIDAKGVESTFGIYSNGEDNNFDWWSNSDNGTRLRASFEFAALGGDMIVDFAGVVGRDNAKEDGEAVASNFGFSVSYLTEVSGIDLAFNFAGGKTNDGGEEFYGGYVMASKEVAENLELVGRVAFATGEGEAEANSRYARTFNKAAFDGIDSVFSLYAGLNYYFIGHNSKVMFGAEFDSVDSDSFASSQEAVTLSAAYRMYF